MSTSWRMPVEVIDCQAIAQAMQHRAQGMTSATAHGANYLTDFLEPYIRLVKRFVDHFEAGQAHGRAFWMRRAGRWNRAQRMERSRDLSLKNLENLARGG